MSYSADNSTEGAGTITRGPLRRYIFRRIQVVCAEAAPTNGSGWWQRLKGC